MANMRKEIAIGFGIISALLMVLGGLVYRRATATIGPDDPTPVRQAAKPIDAQPRVVEAQDSLPMDQTPGDAGRDLGTELAGAQEPLAMDDQSHASFLPQQFDENQPDPTDVPTVDPSDPANPTTLPDEADPAEPSAGDDAMLGDPFHGRRTSLQSPEGNGDLKLADDPGRLGERPDWTGADGATTDSQPTSGTFPNDAGFEQPQTQWEGRDAADGGRQPGNAYSRPHREPERVAVENGRYRVVPNDNYWIISEKVYGNGGYFKALFEVNRQHHPRGDKLQVGDVIEVPAAGTLAEKYPDLCPKTRRVPSARQTLQSASTRHRAGERVYVVAEGDTLFDIARHELGKAARWIEIYEQNHDVLGEDFDYLRPGTELVLPRDARGDNDTMTRKDDPVLR